MAQNNQIPGQHVISALRELLAEANDRVALANAGIMQLKEQLQEANLRISDLIKEQELHVQQEMDAEAGNVTRLPGS